MIPLPYLVLGALVVGFTLGGYSGWTGNSWKHAYEREKIAAAQREALGLAAAEIAKIDVTNQTIHSKVVEHVIEKPVYRDCKHEPDDLRLLNDALAGRAPSSTADKLPEGPGPVDRPEFWGNLLKARGGLGSVPQVP